MPRSEFRGKVGEDCTSWAFGISVHTDPATGVTRMRMGPPAWGPWQPVQHFGQAWPWVRAFRPLLLSVLFV